MKATGIVRRIDDLNRVVVPKEVMRSMGIKTGDPLAIFTDKNGAVIFKKYINAMVEETMGASEKNDMIVHLDADEAGQLLNVCCNHRSLLTQKMQDELRSGMIGAEEAMANVMDELYFIGQFERAIKNEDLRANEMDILDEWDTIDNDLEAPNEDIKTISFQFNEGVTEERKAEIMEHIGDLLYSEEVSPDVVILEL